MNWRTNFRNSIVFVVVAYLALPCGGAAGQAPDSGSNPITKNSTKKIRVKPSKLAAMAGTAVNWAKNFEDAQEQSNATGKPIFWYVPTIRGTFTDRKPVIDRYMMAGYFSWPQIIAQLNKSYIPVKAAPTRDQQKKYELSSYKFIEPGFLIVMPDGREKAKVDRLTTQHPNWMIGYLAKHSQTAQESIADSASTLIPSLAADIPNRSGAHPDDTLIQDSMIQAMKVFRSGDHDAAKAAWESIAEEHPEHPLGWKSAAEAQGIGPFVRGFEVLSDLPQRSFLAGIESAGSAAPATTFTQQQIWNRCVDFLLGMQRDDGGFYDSDYDFGGTDSMPNVRVAVTALVGMALLESRQAIGSARIDDVENSILRCLDFVTNEKNINRIDRDEILWADTYRLRFIARCHSDSKKTDLDQKLQSAVKALENLQSRRGTWYHEYENPFVTATALVALHEAKAAGSQIDARKVEAGVLALEKLRGKDGSYPYGARPSKGGTNAIAASAGRMPLCELALHHWGKSDQNRLRYAIEQSFEFHRHLDSALKYDNHTSTYGYGGFFFWYDMRSRTEAIAAIEDQELRRKMMRQQLEIVMRLPELDGCFVDSHELGRCYGTAMALLCLKRIHKVLKD